MAESTQDFFDRLLFEALSGKTTTAPAPWESAAPTSPGTDVKPREKKPETVYRIINRTTGEPVGSYSRAYCDEYDFHSPREARSANVHGIFEDRTKYKIARYRVTYELLDDDCDGPLKADGPYSPLPHDPSQPLVCYPDTLTLREDGLYATPCGSTIERKIASRRKDRLG